MKLMGIVHSALFLAALQGHGTVARLLRFWLHCLRQHSKEPTVRVLLKRGADLPSPTCGPQPLPEAVLAEEIEGHHKALKESFPLSDRFAFSGQSLMYMVATGQWRNLYMNSERTQTSRTNLGERHYSMLFKYAGWG